MRDSRSPEFPLESPHSFVKYDSSNIRSDKSHGLVPLDVYKRQGQSLLAWASGFLDPLGRFMGLDGVILIAFILGFPANEIVIPIIIMAYMANGSLIEMSSLAAMKDLFLAQGWTLTTAVCTLIFVLFHWPCSTTCLTIYKETKSCLLYTSRCV